MALVSGGIQIQPSKYIVIIIPLKRLFCKSRPGEKYTNISAQKRRISEIFTLSLKKTKKIRPAY
jgi:hypothetical protein